MLRETQLASIDEVGGRLTNGFPHSMPAVTSALCLALLLACTKGSSSVRPGSSVSPTAANEPSARAEVDSTPLTRELVRRLETTAPSIENPCTRGRLLLRTLAHTRGADRERVLLAAKSVAQLANTDGTYAGCLYEAAAELVRHLPSSEQHAAVDRVLDVVESKQLGWVFSVEVLRALGALLDREQVARLEQYVRGQTHCCVGVEVHAILAKSGRFPAEQALKAARACGGLCGGGTDVLALLPLVDAHAQAEFLAPELKRFEEPPESWSTYELHLLAKIAPYVEEKRRHELLVVAFRRMPELGVEEDRRAGWGELAPPAHYHFVLVQLAPFVTPDILPNALYSLPREWAPEVRSLVLGHFAASLRPEVRRRSLPTILDALPNAADDLHYVSARLLLAGDLPDAQVLKLFRRFLELEERPYERAEVSASLLGSSRGQHRTEIERSFYRELERVESAARRGDLLATAIEALNR